MTRKFTLHALLRLRARDLEQKHGALARANQACARAELHLAELRRSETRALGEAARQTGGSLAGFWGSQAGAVREASVRSREAYLDLEAARELARREAIQSQQQLKVVERLRDRRAEEARLEERRAEERNLNDLNAARFARGLTQQGGLRS